MIQRTIKRFTPAAKPILFSFIAMIALVVSNGVSLVTLQPIIDQIFVAPGDEVSFVVPVLKTVFRESKRGMLVDLVLFFVASRLVYCVALYLNRYLMMIAGELMVNKLRRDLYDKLLSFSPSYYAKSRSGELVANLTSDLGLVQHLLSTITSDLIRRPFEIIFLIGLLFAFDVKLAFASLLVAPFIVVIVNKLGRSVRGRSSKMQSSMGDVASALAETTSGIKTIQSFAAERSMTSKFRDLADRYLGRARRAYLAIAAATPITEFVTALSIAAIILYGGVSVIDGRTTTGSFFTFMAILMATYQPVKTLVNALSEANRAAAALARVYAVIDTHPSIRNLGSAPAAFVRELRFENVSFAYDGIEERDVFAIRGASLVIARGETVAVVGPSGAGKSTLLSLIPRFYDPSEGAILLDGVDLREIELLSLRRTIGMVLQETFLFNDTIAANIALGRPDATRAEIDAAARAAHLADFIAALPSGLDTVVGERGARLSGGEKQRISIARALLIDPPLLLLDEATSSLDSESERKVQAAIEELLKGRTAVVIAHRLSTVQRADRIVVMDKGRVVEQGTHAELLGKRGLYARLHELQFNA